MSENSWAQAIAWGKILLALYALIFLSWFSVLVMGKVVDSFVEVTVGITKAIWGNIFGLREGWELAAAWLATIGITLYSIAWAGYSFYEYWQERQIVQKILEWPEWGLKGYVGAIQRESERRPQQISLVLAFNHVRKRADQVLAILKELETERQTKSS